MGPAGEQSRESPILRPVVASVSPEAHASGDSCVDEGIRDLSRRRHDDGGGGATSDFDAFHFVQSRAGRCSRASAANWARAVCQTLVQTAGAARLPRYHEFGRQPRFVVIHEEALASSVWLVLMASPEAARSKWVNREVAWWLNNKSPQRLLVVLTEGEFAWDEKGGRAPPALPPALHGAFVKTPRWWIYAGYTTRIK